MIPRNFYSADADDLSKETYPHHVEGPKAFVEVPFLMNTKTFSNHKKIGKY